jgi:hypothetical protein
MTLLYKNIPSTAHEVCRIEGRLELGDNEVHLLIGTRNFVI